MCPRISFFFRSNISIDISCEQLGTWNVWCLVSGLISLWFITFLAMYISWRSTGKTCSNIFYIYHNLTHFRWKWFSVFFYVIKSHVILIGSKVRCWYNVTRSQKIWAWNVIFKGRDCNIYYFRLKLCNILLFYVFFTLKQTLII